MFQKLRLRSDAKKQQKTQEEEDSKANNVGNYWGLGKFTWIALLSGTTLGFSAFGSVICGFSLFGTAYLGGVTVFGSSFFADTIFGTSYFGRSWLGNSYFYNVSLFNSNPIFCSIMLLFLIFMIVSILYRFKFFR